MTENRFKGFDWLATVFYPLAVILMEAFWVSPWLNWVGTWPFFRQGRPVLHLVSVIIVLAASLVVTRYFSRRNLKMGAIQAVVIGSGFIVLLLVLAAEYAEGYTFLSGAWWGHIARVIAGTLKEPSSILAALPVIIYLWWRGIMLGQSTTYFKDIYRSFVIGLAALILLFIVWQGTSSARGMSTPAAGLGFNVIGFFFFGLLAISICHLYVMRSSMPREDAALTSVWRWMPIMLGVVGGMIIIGFLIASILSPDMMHTLGQAVSVLGNALMTLIKWILTPFLWVVTGIFYAIRWLLSLLRQEKPPEEPQQPGGGMPDWGEITTKEMPAWLGEALKWFIVAVIVAAVIFFLARAVSKYRARKEQEEMDEVNESLFSWKGLKDDLKEFLNGIGQRFQRKEQEAGIRFDPDFAGRMDIRDIFRHLQWEGKAAGVTRRRHETAAEYARRLERAVPQTLESIAPARETIGGIREMYESVRYGESALPEPKVDKANSLSVTLKDMLRKLRGA